ncbi:MAG: hypothetical protein JXR34_09425 [Bacteroidales bacterium]|nr:hypothetical protein [Bacteroidales bacterium]
MFGKKKQPENIKNAPKVEDFKAEIKERKASSPKPPKSPKAITKNPVNQFFTSILDGSFLTRNWMIKMLPFIMFLVLLALIYIGNQYAALRRVKEIENISKELKVLRNEHISTKSELMHQKRISEIARKLEVQGIKESNIPPAKIFVEPQTTK